MKTKLLCLLLDIAHIVIFTAVLFLLLLGIDIAVGITTLWGLSLMLITIMHVTMCYMFSAIELKGIL